MCFKYYCSCEGAKVKGLITSKAYNGLDHILGRRFPWDLASWLSGMVKAIVERVDAVTLSSTVLLLLFCCHRSLNRKKKGLLDGAFTFESTATTRAIYGQLYMLTWIMAQQHGNFCQKQFREPHLSHHRTKQTDKQTNHKKKIILRNKKAIFLPITFRYFFWCSILSGRKGINLHLRMILQLLFF